MKDFYIVTNYIELGIWYKNKDGTFTDIRTNECILLKNPNISTLGDSQLNTNTIFVKNNSTQIKFDSSELIKFPDVCCVNLEDCPRYLNGNIYSKNMTIRFSKLSVFNNSIVLFGEYIISFEDITLTNNHLNCFGYPVLIRNHISIYFNQHVRKYDLPITLESYNKYSITTINIMQNIFAKYPAKSNFKSSEIITCKIIMTIENRSKIILTKDSITFNRIKLKVAGMKSDLRSITFDVVDNRFDYFGKFQQFPFSTTDLIYNVEGIAFPLITDKVNISHETSVCHFYELDDEILVEKYFIKSIELLIFRHDAVLKENLTINGLVKGTPSRKLIIKNDPTLLELYNKLIFDFDNIDFGVFEILKLKLSNNDVYTLKKLSFPPLLQDQNSYRLNEFNLIITQ